MKNLKMVITAILLFAVLVGIGMALPPPVDQNVPIRDTSLYYYTESQCRTCHNSTFLGGVPTRHHNIPSRGVINPQTGQVYGCMDCHPVVTGPNGQSVLFDRNCKACHNGTTFYATTAINLSKPHHIDTVRASTNIGQPAQQRQCDVCHGGIIDNYNDGHYIPTYPTSLLITPFADYKARNASTGKLWGGCRACHWNDTGGILTNADTHHIAVRGSGGLSGTKQTEKTPGETCSWCHVEKPDIAGAHGRVNITINGVVTKVMEFRNSTKEAMDRAIGDAALETPGITNVTKNGTGCEKCHSVATLHNIQYDYANTSNTSGSGHIGANWDCNGCHASWDAGSQPLGGVIIPYVDSVEPDVFIAGQATVVTISGGNFIQATYSTKVSVDGVIYDPTTVSDSQIVVTVPALAAGVHTLQVVKGDVKTALKTLTAVIPVTITSAKLSDGVITVVGSGFGTAAQQYVTIAKAGGNVVYSDSITNWGDAQIVVVSSVAAVGDTITVTTPTGSATATITAGTQPPADPTITSAKLVVPKKSTTGTLTILGTALGNSGTVNDVYIEIAGKKGKTTRYNADSITSWTPGKIVAVVAKDWEGQTVNVNVGGKIVTATIT